MPANYVLLEKITVGAAGAASVTFANIPQTGYTDLKLVMSTRLDSASGANFNYVKFNGSSTGFTIKTLEGSGSGAGSGSASTGNAGLDEGTSYTANTFSNTEIYIPNYTSSNYKSYSVDTVTENNATQAYMEMVAGLWSNTAAITSVTVYPDTGGRNYVQYSTFYLYGLAAVGATPAIDPKATGGDIIQTDGTYWYHAFLSSGTFTPKSNLTCDILQVAGGGGGSGWDYGQGGGGAGGVLAFASQLLNANTGQTVTVGAGGAGNTNGTTGTNGGNSSFGSITPVSLGGGGAGIPNSLSGGSGGGAGYSGTGGSGTSGQGYAGGNGTAIGQKYPGAGGGGAGGVGGNTPNVNTGGTGGAGVNTVTNWGALSSAFAVLPLGVGGYIAGGGGGGVYNTYGGGATAGTATAGGGNGAIGGLDVGNGVGVGYPGTPNTGGGGGASGNGTNGANGGSGLVIVRYTVA